MGLGTDYPSKTIETPENANPCAILPKQAMSYATSRRQSIQRNII